MAQKIQLRRDTLAAFVAANVILSNGEPAYTNDTKTYRIGDGVTAFADLPTFTKQSDLTAALAGVATQAALNAVIANNVTQQTSIDGLEVNIVNLSNAIGAVETSQAAQSALIVGLQAEDAAIDLRLVALESATIVSIDGGNAAG